jgi:hypothetical protein
MKSRKRASRKSLVGIAAAVVVGGSAIGVVTVAAASHGATLAAQSAGFSTSDTHRTAEWTQLNSVISGWGMSRQHSLSMLASMPQQTLTQTTMHSKTMDEQRGIVVLATSQFLILQSSNGSYHLWTLSGRTKFDNVSQNTAGTMALTADRSAAQQAVASGDMLPAASEMAGSPTVAAQMLSPSMTPQSYTIRVTGTDLTVTVTIARSMATVSQTATTPAYGTPYMDPMTSTENAWTTVSRTTMLARGDLALVVGTRSHGVLNAQIVLYQPMSASDVGTYRTGMAPPTATATPTASVSAGNHW